MVDRHKNPDHTTIGQSFPGQAENQRIELLRVSVTLPSPGRS
jgi:hypothetical protein